MLRKVSETLENGVVAVISSALNCLRPSSAYG